MVVAKKEIVKKPRQMEDSGWLRNANQMTADCDDFSHFIGPITRLLDVLKIRSP